MVQRGVYFNFQLMAIMFAGSEKVGVSPQPKLSTVSGVKSINLTVGLENTNVADVLRRNSHSKILEWLQNKNLGKYDIEM